MSYSLRILKFPCVPKSFRFSCDFSRQNPCERWYSESTHGNKEVASAKTGQVGHAAGVHVVEVLDSRTAVGVLQLHLHDGGDGLGAAEDEPESFAGPVKDHGAGFRRRPAKIPQILPSAHPLRSGSLMLKPSKNLYSPSGTSFH